MIDEYEDLILNDTDENNNLEDELRELSKNKDDENECLKNVFTLVRKII